MKTRISSAALLLAVASIAPATAQNTPAAANPTTLTVDFTAYGPGGAPVFDLKPEEITVSIGNNERPVRGLELVRLAGPDPGGDVPPPFASSVATRPRSRTLLIVLDDDSMRPGREGAFRPAVAQLLESLAPADRVAIVTVPLGGIRLDFTTDHAKAGEVFKSLGGKAPRTESASDFACRARRTLEATASILNNMGGGEGPTTVVFISSSMSGPTRDSTVQTIGPGMCELAPEKFDELAVAAARARAAFVVLQPEDQIIAPGSVGAADIASGRIAGFSAGLEALAGVTGSELVRLRGGATDVTERILRDSTSYYLARIDTDNSDRGISRLEVTTSRPDVTIRSRTRIALTPTSADAGRKAAVTPRDMLRQSRGYAEFPMRSTGYVASNAGDSRLRVVAVTEVEPGVKLASAAVGIFETTGKLIAQWTAQPEELTGPAFVAVLLAPPGTYRLRVAATDTNGKAATADEHLNAILETAGPIKMSGLLLGASHEGAFMPRMLFSSEPTAIAQVELTGVPAGERPTGRLEIAKSINGPALASGPVAITPTQDPTRAIVSGALPIGGLAPGDYVVRIVVTPAEGPAGRVVRTLRKVS
ncbi:MAG: hypothetical protein WD690_13260 [Vicinamibacterales bacterium]